VVPRKHFFQARRNAQEKILATVIGHELYTNRKTVSRQCNGSEIAGCPLMLNGIVKSPPDRSIVPGSQRSQSGGGCWSVGVRSRSNPLAHYSGARITPAASVATA
jgi:hypothetical protein